MESLGEVLKRIVSKQDFKPRLTPSQIQELDAVEAEPCQTCDGAAWVSRHVPVGHEDFGKAFPCPVCVGTIDEGDAMKKKFLENFPHKKSPRNFQNFDRNTPQRQKLFEEIMGWMADPARPQVLTLAGPNGTGKSHALEALGRELAEVRGWPVQYQRATRLMAQFRGELGAENPNLDRIFSYLAMPELLIIDDVTEYGTKFSAEVLEDILEPRYMGKGYLAIGTNIPVEVMAEKWSYRLADRIFDIESGDTQVIYTMGRSYRTSKVWPILGRRK